MNAAIGTDTAHRQRGLSRNRAAKKRLRKNIAMWTLQALLAITFIIGGVAKLSANPIMVPTFDRLGFGQGFRCVIASIDIVCGTLLLVPLLARFAATVLSCTMFAMATAEVAIIGGSPIPAVVLGTLCAIVAAYRWRSFARARRMPILAHAAA